MTFGTFGHAKVREKKSYFKYLAGRRRRRPLQHKIQVQPRKKSKNIYFIPSAHRLSHARPAFIAGVQTMRARICSASSCDMFARVVWLKPWGAAKPPIFTLSFVAHTRHAWLARLTRARGKRFQREWNALFDDFWYFWSYKSTI